MHFLNFFSLFSGISQKRVNIIYALDQSNTVSPKQFNELSEFVAGSLDLYQMGSAVETRVGISTFDDVKMTEQLSVTNGTSIGAVKDTLSRIQASRLRNGFASLSSLDLNSVMKTVSLDMFGMERLDTKGVLVLLVAGKPSSVPAYTVFDVTSRERIEALQKSGKYLNYILLR